MEMVTVIIVLLLITTAAYVQSKRDLLRNSIANQAHQNFEGMSLVLEAIANQAPQNIRNQNLQNIANQNPQNLTWIEVSPFSECPQFEELQDGAVLLVKDVNLNDALALLKEKGENAPIVETIQMEEINYLYALGKSFMVVIKLP